jgi:hypothetical protein
MQRVTVMDARGNEHTFTPKAPKVKINNTNSLREQGLSVVHFNTNFLDTHITRPVTIVYKMKNRNVIEMATAVCHSADIFTKKVGTKTAIQNFYEGKTIMLPYFKDSRPSDFIQSLFL